MHGKLPSEGIAAPSGRDRCPFGRDLCRVRKGSLPYVDGSQPILHLAGTHGDDLIVNHLVDDRLVLAISRSGGSRVLIEGGIARLDGRSERLVVVQDSQLLMGSFD